MAGSKQLISQFNPDTYNLNLEIDKQHKTFSGKLLITGSRRSRPSYRITLNQNGLKVSSAKIYRLDKEARTEIIVDRIVHQNKRQEVRLHSKSQITSGKYEIELEHNGHISTKGTSGIYTSTWLDEQDTTQEIITTQFEPHYARQLLPCIDEPQAKSVFKLSLLIIGVSKSDQALFNTKSMSIQDTDSARSIVFEPTPVMSTYLLALIIGDFKSISRKSTDGTNVSAYSTPDKIDQTEFALQFAIKVLDFLEDKFQTPYPLNKLDLVAVPDFDAGGMENWGLMTFREDLMLFDETVSTLIDKQAIAQVIAHEIAHQWFGNLVTMKWWDELWLKEGFANFMEYYVLDSLFPEWKMFEGYLVNERSYATIVDSIPSSRPIIKKVSSPYHSVEIFDGIAYEKSGSIIRMIKSIIGEDNFMKGLKDYFDKYAYKTATSEDLISSWQKYSSLNLKEFTRTWLYKPGLPMLLVSIGKNQSQLVLEQSRFLSEPKAKISEERISSQLLKSEPNIKKLSREYKFNLLKKQNSQSINYIWNIPISFISGDSNQKSIDSIVMTKQKHLIQLAANSQLPLKINKEGSAFFLASYSKELLARISEAIRLGTLSDLETLNVLSDIISLNRARKFDPGAPAILEFISSGKESINPHYWSLIGGFIGYLHYHLRQVNKTALLGPCISKLIAPNIDRIGYDVSPKDSSDKVMTRFELLSLAALGQDQLISNKLGRLYKDLLSQGIESIESEKRLLALYVVAKKGKKSDYKQILNLYKENISDPNLRDDLTYALCLFEDETLVKDNLALMQDASLVRAQDILSWLSQVISAGHIAKSVTLDWVTKQGGWVWLSDNLSAHDLSTAVKIVTSTAFTTIELNKIKKFYQKVDNIELEKALSEALDMAKSRISWHKNELPKVIDYLS